MSPIEKGDTNIILLLRTSSRQVRYMVLFKTSNKSVELLAPASGVLVQVLEKVTVCLYRCRALIIKAEIIVFL